MLAFAITVAGEAMSILDILLRGVAAGALLSTGLGLLGGGRKIAARWTSALFCLSVAAFAVHSGGAETQALGGLGRMVWFLSVGGAAYFWLFATSLFDDRPFGWARLVPAVGMTALAGVAESLSRPTADGVWIAHYLLQVALVLHVLLVIARNWSGDLVEARRSMRGPFLGFVAVYAIALSVQQVAELLGYRAGWEGLAQAASLAVVALAGSAVLLGARPGLFDPPVRAAQPEAVALRDRPALAALEALMAGDEIWRREGLTIGELARELAIPEHRLRRLINVGLGARNFSSFLNGRRVTAAKVALADPARARETVAAIAFEMGFTSLGPFNRAFREATGTTPTAWREAALRGSLIPQKPG